MEPVVVAVANAERKEMKVSKKALMLREVNEKLASSIADQATKLRQLREESTAAGRAWREDPAVMDAVFQLMSMKLRHPDFRHEVFAEGVKDTVIKLRWKVIGPDGGVVVLQRPFRGVSCLRAAEIREAVAEFTKAKYPKLSPFLEYRVVEKSADKKVESVKRELLADEEFRLSIVFPGPKFDAKRVIVLQCLNNEMVDWLKAKPERETRQKIKLAEDQKRKEQRIAEKRAAKAAANPAPAGAGPNAGRGVGGRVAKKGAKKGARGRGRR